VRGATYIVLSLLAVLLLPYAESIVDLPQWSTNVLLGILIVGFPVAIFLAWNYERSPEGFVRTSSKESWQNPYKGSQKKPLTGNLIIAGMALIIIIMYFFPRQMSSDSNPIPGAAEAFAPVIDKSIAVIPFVNMSNDPDQEYFSDGMMEEIINHLVKIKDLKVVSRTTAMKYKGSSKTTKEIAQELGVATILEGSVRKEGDQVRITVQLIEGHSNMHLFSESYDRQLTSIFEVQSDVAQLVANSLKAQVSPEVKLRIEEIPTLNSRAYELYLKGRQQYYLFWSEWDASLINDGIEYYNQALALDPDFSNAYAGLGQCYWMLAHFSPDYDPIQWDLSKKYLQKAIDLDPDNGWAYAELGVVQHNWDWDKKATLRSFQKAVELSPGDREIRNHLRIFYHRTGECDKAEAETRIMYSLENRDYDPKLDLYLLICRRDLEQISELDPNSDHYTWILDAIRLMMFQGQYQKLIQYVNNTSLSPDNFSRIIMLTTLGEAYALSGDSLRSMQVVEELKELSKTRHITTSNIAPIYMALGDHQMAFQLLEEALEKRDVQLHLLAGFYVSMYNMQDDPRYVSLMERSWIPQE